MLPDLHTGFSRGRSGGLVFPSLSEFSTVYCDPHKGFGIVNKAERDVFLEFSCFCNDQVGVGNLISGSSAFSKTSLNIWKFIVHVLLKRDLENFKHYLLVCEMSAIVWYFDHSLALYFSGIGMKSDLFQSCGHCWVFQICWHIECSTFTASSFRIWKSSTGIPSSPLPLFVVMLPKAHLTSHSSMSSCRCVDDHTIMIIWVMKIFLLHSSVYSWFLFLISSASVRSLPFLSFIEPIFAWNIPFLSLIFLKTSLVYLILLFSSISLHCSLSKAFLSLLAILWNSAFKWVYLFFSPLPLPLFFT